MLETQKDIEFVTNLKQKGNEIEIVINAGSYHTATTKFQLIGSRVINAAVKPSTARNYQHHWERFRHFVMTVLLLPFQLPLDTQIIIMFLSYLYDQGLTYSTILSYVVAINHNLKIRSYQGCSDSFLVQKFMRGAKNSW